MRVSYKRQYPSDYESCAVELDGKEVAAVEADDNEGWAVINLVNSSGRFLHNGTSPAEVVVWGECRIFKKPVIYKLTDVEVYEHQQALINKASRGSQTKCHYPIVGHNS